MQGPLAQNVSQVAFVGRRGVDIAGRVDLFPGGMARDLVNEPANVLGPVEFAKEAASLKSLGVSIEILDEKKMAGRLERSIAKVIADGTVRTYDMGGDNTTLEVAEEVARNL